MIYKSYIVEKILSKLKITLYFSQNDFKETIKKLNLNIKIVNFDQDDLIKNKEYFFNEIFNFSSWKRKNFFLNNVNDKILSIIENIDQKIDQQKIYLFANLLDKKSKLRDLLRNLLNLRLFLVI